MPVLPLAALGAAWSPAVGASVAGALDVPLRPSLALGALAVAAVVLHRGSTPRGVPPVATWMAIVLAARTASRKTVRFG